VSGADHWFQITPPLLFIVILRILEGNEIIHELSSKSFRCRRLLWNWSCLDWLHGLCGRQAKSYHIWICSKKIISLFISWETLIVQQLLFIPNLVQEHEHGKVNSLRHAMMIESLW
jgi:hypothetical protein